METLSLALRREAEVLFMPSESSRHQRKWRNGVLGLVATIAPIAAYADLVNPLAGHTPAPFAKTYAVNAPKFVAPLKRSTLDDYSPSSKVAAAQPSSAARKRIVPTPVSRLGNRQAQRKTPMTLALLLMVQAQSQSNSLR